MTARPLVVIERNAADRLGAYLSERGLQRLALVADANTYAALGRRVDAALNGAGFDVRPILLGGHEVIVDEQQIVDVLLRNDSRERAFLAIGSGTVTDIVRFVTLQTGGAFISLPTATSMDGYSSPVTPMVIRKLKLTGPGHLPQAIFADLDTLCAAPRHMIAAGVGDVIAKWTSNADWRLGALLWGDRYDEAIARRFAAAVEHVATAATEIGNASDAGIRALMEGLIECGLCMADFGTSLPASGSEHLLSHFWESRLLAERRPALLHGAKVGVGTVLASDYWQKIRGLSHSAAAERLSASRLPERHVELARIREGWPFAIEPIMTAQARFLDLTEADYRALLADIRHHWSEIQVIAAAVPPPNHVANVLRTVGGPTTAEEAGLQARDLADGLEYAHYLRDRLPVLRLRRFLGLH